MTPNLEAVLIVAGIGLLLLGHFFAAILVGIIVFGCRN